MFLIDTNIISEVRKAERCDPYVAAWYADVNDNDLYLSVLVTGEIRKGIERLRSRDRQKSDVLQHWLQMLEQGFGERILPINLSVADEWGRLSALRATPVIDGLLAATAKVFDLTLVTRNTDDVAGLGVKILNPFTPLRAT
ncbi:MAG: type II toxin-antitoxin system VapC family toxin [Alphaproteobacteria bacterium]